MGQESNMEIRKAVNKDICRIAEIKIFNYRLNFYPIFKSDDYYFNELSVENLYDEINKQIDSYYVYDDGVVKGYIQVIGNELKQLFVEPVLQNNNIGQKLLIYAIKNLDANYLYALEKNVRAIKFYIKNGFILTNEKVLEEDTSEYLVKMIYK